MLGGLGRGETQGANAIHTVHTLYICVCVCYGRIVTVTGLLCTYIHVHCMPCITGITHMELMQLSCTELLKAVRGHAVNIYTRVDGTLLRV